VLQKFDRLDRLNWIQLEMRFNEIDLSGAISQSPQLRYCGFHSYLMCKNLTMVEFAYPKKRRQAHHGWDFSVTGMVQSILLTTQKLLTEKGAAIVKLSINFQRHPNWIYIISWGNRS